MTTLSFIGDAIRQGKARNVGLDTVREWHDKLRGIPESALPGILECLPPARAPKNFPQKVWTVWENIQTKLDDIQQDDAVIEKALAEAPWTWPPIFTREWWSRVLVRWGW